MVTTSGSDEERRSAGAARPQHAARDARRPLPRGVADRPALVMHKLGDEVLRRAEQPLEEMGLTGREYVTLAVLATDAPGSQAELAAFCGLLPAQLVTVIDELERDGLAARSRDETDRRRSVVRMTAKGRRLLARADALAARIEDELLGHLDADQRARLHDVLREALEGNWTMAAGMADETPAVA
jgi:DNA-binding MarR family transcriptional regulator